MVSRDVTALSQARALLEDSQDRLERAVQASGLGLWELDLDTGRFHIDERFARNVGYDPGELRTHWDTAVAMVHPDDAVAVSRRLEAHLRGETTHWEFEARMLTRAGQWTWIAARGRALHDSRGQPARMSGTLKNIDAERALAERLAQADRRVQLLLRATDEGIVGLDRDGVCTFVNPAATALLGVPAEALLGRGFDDCVRHTAEDGRPLLGADSPLVQCLVLGERRLGADELLWRDGGGALPVEYSVSPVLDEGRPAGAVLAFRDVSEKRVLARQLAFQAVHDPLTGLINRRGFEQRLERLLRSAREASREHALCYLDLDHFKVINDACGHVAGDELLRRLPPLLEARLRGRGTLARIGGDEFAVLLEDCALPGAAGIAAELHEAVRAFRFVWQERAFRIGASIGVAPIDGREARADAVLAAADAACYVAKEQGPHRVHVSLPDDGAVRRRRGEMRWVARLKTALDEGHFRLHCMSIAALHGAAPARHHELLLRLADPGEGLVLPGAFLPAAERYQLMAQIDRWVVEHALAFLGRQLAGNTAMAGHCFGLNLSGESLRDPRLPEFIRQALAAHGVPPSMIYFEVTETAAIASLAAAVELMHGLRALGCRLALDDFGSGMSSFAYLKHLPVDFVKIDGSFIRELPDNPVDQAIVRAVQAVGSQMGIATVAEYVESNAIKDCLREMGIQYGQGYAIAPPVALEEFARRNGAVAVEINGAGDD